MIIDHEPGEEPILEYASNHKVLVVAIWIGIVIATLLFLAIIERLQMGDAGTIFATLALCALLMVGVVAFSMRVRKWWLINHKSVETV
jgi:multidrug transporter EmrE-like cation transporter